MKRRGLWIWIRENMHIIVSFLALALAIASAGLYAAERDRQQKREATWRPHTLCFATRQISRGEILTANSLPVRCITVYSEVDEETRAMIDNGGVWLIPQTTILAGDDGKVQAMADIPPGVPIGSALMPWYDLSYPYVFAWLPATGDFLHAGKVFLSFQVPENVVSVFFPGLSPDDPVFAMLEGVCRGIVREDGGNTKCLFMLQGMTIRNRDGIVAQWAGDALAQNILPAMLITQLAPVVSDVIARLESPVLPVPEWQATPTPTPAPTAPAPQVTPAP
ncbi:hypothetical protein [Thermogutta sp.]|uniref:hypothetical protein n=1 Tax=Thermogutta sp. TaxID=1962930 RepID=UPI0032201E2E